MNPPELEHDAWLLACETLDGIAVHDDDGQIRNPEVFTISPADAQLAVEVARARLVLVHPDSCLRARFSAARTLGLSREQELALLDGMTDADLDRNGVTSREPVLGEDGCWVRT